MPTVADLKQEIAKVNNRVNQAMFGAGLRWQKVEVLGDRIFITSENMRIKPLAALDEQDRLATRIVDIALINEFKARLRQELESLLGVGVKALLKDYDPKSQISGTIIITDEKLNDAG
ncbi:MAG TPA: Na-translocating system protein MpsC family protein [Symbiobacteriaceae bacterium]|nr:Na-translocating system protein MpsC family protein [Symbiobacteriaceae bacterium]